MKRLILGFTLGLILVSSAISTELSKIKFEYLTVDDGLSQGIIEDIFQDRHGYMWFATRDGLNRYDGRRFVIFRNERNNPQSLASNWVLSLAEDKAGKIWIGSEGLNLYDPFMDRMIRIPVNPEDPNAFQGGRVYSITIDYDSTILVLHYQRAGTLLPKTKQIQDVYTRSGKSQIASQQGRFQYICKPG
jgi:ligand-binding sensor domain-containing protein